MSYPTVHVKTDDHITFTIPSTGILRRIVRDSEEEEENLRIHVLGKSLSRRIEGLACLFSKYDFEVLPVFSPNEIHIKMDLRPRYVGACAQCVSPKRLSTIYEEEE